MPTIPLIQLQRVGHLKNLRVVVVFAIVGILSIVKDIKR